MCLCVVQNEADDVAYVFQDQGIGGNSSSVAMSSRNQPPNQIAGLHCSQSEIPYPVQKQEGPPAHWQTMVLEQGGVPLAFAW